MSLIEALSSCEAAATALDAHRGLAGGLFGDLDRALVWRETVDRPSRWFASGRRHRRAGRASGAPCFEFADIAFDRLLARHRAGIALALLRLDPALSSACCLKVSSAPASAPISSCARVAGIDCEIAGGDLHHTVAHIVQRRDDAGVTINKAPTVKTMAAESSTSCNISDRSAARILRHGVVAGGVERGFGDATAARADRRERVHWFAVNSASLPACSA
jgi:hypothetical protein